MKPGCARLTGTNGTIATQVATPTTRPRVSPPPARPMVRSSGVKGGISRSTMLPWILEMRIEDEVLAKAFWVIAIMMRPGARNAM